MGKKGTYSTSEESISNPFAQALQGMVAERQTVDETPEESVTPVASRLFYEGATLVVRKERKGRGGKTASVLSGLSGSADELKQLAKELGKALGCGVSVDQGELVIQGDQRSRLKKWMEDKGARRVKISGG